MGDKFKLNEDGNCGACNKISLRGESVPCYTCKGLFHVACESTQVIIQGKMTMMDNHRRHSDLVEREFDLLERQFDFMEQEFNAAERKFERVGKCEDENKENMKYWNHTCIRILGSRWSSEKPLTTYNSVETTKIIAVSSEVEKIGKYRKKSVKDISKECKRKYIITESSTNEPNYKSSAYFDPKIDKPADKDNDRIGKCDQDLSKIDNQYEEPIQSKNENQMETSLKSALKKQGNITSLQSFSTVSWEEANKTIVINVSGEVFETYLRTLNRYPNTLLGDPKSREKYLNEEGELFFNRSSDAFEAILYYYQSKGEMYYPSYLPLDKFIQELAFFKLGDEVIHRLEIEQGLIEAPGMDLPNAYLLQVIWKVLEYPDSSKVAKIFAFSSVSVIFLSTILFILESLPEFSQPITVYINRTRNNTIDNVTKISIYEDLIMQPNKHSRWLMYVNTTIIIWFTSEFILRFLSCPNKLKFWTNITNLIDLTSVAPYYIEQSSGRALGVVRVFRVLRILKLSRHSSGMQLVARTILATYSDLLMAGGLLMVLVLIFSSLVYYAEYQIPGTVFKSIPHAAWWSVVTLTTVGYGDMWPVTTFGKLVGSLTLLSGTLVLSLPLPSVVSNFTYFLNVERLKKQMQQAKEKEKQKERNKEEEMEKRAINREMNKRVDDTGS